MNALEKHVEPLHEYPNEYASLIDGMALVQKSSVVGLAFGQFADQLLQSVLAVSRNAERIDVIFDVYQAGSIKTAERIRRSCGQIVIRNIVPTCPIRQWHEFLSTSSNKIELIRFIAGHWKNHDHFINVESGKFFVALDNRCIELSNNGERIVEQLACKQGGRYKDLLSFTTCYPQP